MSVNIDRNTIISNQLILKFWPLAATFLLIYTPVSFFITRDYFAAWFLLGSVIAFAVVIYFYYKKRSVIWVGNILALIGYPVLLPWLITGGPSGTALWWSAIYVVWVFFITTKIWGFIWLSLYALLCAIVYVLSLLDYLTIAYSGEQLLNILFAFVITYCLVYFIGEIIMIYLQTSEEELYQRKQAEEKIRKINLELEAEVKKYAKINAQLLDFCDMVSHSLRTPIVRMEMLSDALEDAQTEQEKMELLMRLKPVVNQFNELFNELMETLQVQQDTDIISDRIALAESVRKILMGFERQINTRGARIKTDFADAPEINFPQKYFDNILTNLISNALKFYSPDRTPEIVIKTRKIDGSVILSVEDNGLGIDLTRHKNRLFKIRQVLHDHPESRGFGLYLTKCQVEAMGGSIWADSLVDKGSTFYVEFKNQER